MARDYIAAIMMCLEILEWVEFPPEATAKLTFTQSLGRCRQNILVECSHPLPVALHMPSNHRFQSSARFNTTKLMFGNYRNLTGEVEKHFPPPAEPLLARNKAPRHVLSVGILLSLS